MESIAPNGVACLLEALCLTQHRTSPFVAHLDALNPAADGYTRRQITCKTGKKVAHDQPRRLHPLVHAQTIACFVLLPSMWGIRGSVSERRQSFGRGSRSSLCADAANASEICRSGSRISSRARHIVFSHPRSVR
jgi:hypothetical protein